MEHKNKEESPSTIGLIVFLFVIVYLVITLSSELKPTVPAVPEEPSQLSVFDGAFASTN